jgi:dGTPase
MGAAGRGQALKAEGATLPSCSLSTTGLYADDAASRFGVCAMMEWERLLSPTRLCQPNAQPSLGRNPFQVDRDRIVFSSAFRRLADKTQVHPLSENDHVRTRLTHSVEVASVGRTLANLVGQQIKNILTEAKVKVEDLGHVVEGACLVHDIGNTPFGHSGEKAISDWFSDIDKSSRSKCLRKNLTDHEYRDLCHFEGNAQAFRIMNRLENRVNSGGLRLTDAVLGAFCKYPV